jgi:hypothetical protein
VALPTDTRVSGLFPHFAIFGGCTAAAANTITCDGYTLTFTSAPTVQDVPFGFTSVVNYGQITVTGIGSPSVISGGGSFSMQITQTLPAPSGGSPFAYTATLTAVLVTSASDSYLQFGGPFTRGGHQSIL